MDKTKLIEARDVTGFESELLVHWCISLKVNYRDGLR
jgi:hypothetical protein